jgi:hypothetical protein
MPSKQRERIEYRPTYFVAEPNPALWRYGYSATLMFYRVRTTPTGRVRRILDSEKFDGDTRDEADEKMLAWIDANAAQEVANAE